MIVEAVREALRSAVQTARKRVADAPEIWRFDDDDARLEAIASLATDAVLAMVRPELIEHVPRGRLLHLARVELYSSGYGAGNYGAGKYGKTEPQ